jgi:hypothetical protein
MANTLDDVLKDVADESGLEDSLIALAAGLQAQLNAALAGEVTPAGQAKVDAVFANLEANKAKLAAAVAAPAPAPVPPVVP